MKKIILVLLFTITSAFSYSIISQEKDGSDTVKYLVQCDNGHGVVGFNKRISDGAYFIYGQIVYSMDKAVQIGCKKNTSNNEEIILKKNSLIFKNRKAKKGIEFYLLSKSGYSLAKLHATLGKENVFKLNKNMSVLRLRYYAPYKISTDKDGNYEPKGKYKKLIIDGYFKVKDETGNIYYVKESSIN